MAYVFFLFCVNNITLISQVLFTHSTHSGRSQTLCNFNWQANSFAIILFITLILASSASILGTVDFQRVHILGAVGRGRNRFYRLQHPAVLSLKRSLSVCKQMVCSDFALKLMIPSIPRVVSKPLFLYLRQPFLLRTCRKLISKMSFQYPQAYRDDAVVSKRG